MALGGPYAPMRPELDPFLFAAVGEELDGIPLSVLSVLSRLGLDPRGEAARLSQLANETATEQLARTIAGLPGARWTSTEMQKIAAGLIDLLPAAAKRGETAATAGGAECGFGRGRSRFVICVALAAVLLIGLLAHGALSPGVSGMSRPASETTSQTPPG